MSKGNLFLGMASGSVGDVTMYRTNGQQIARARNRRPSNPRSDAQLYQRAILATISRVYQLGHAIFDHSFQGYRRGAENQRRFQKLNLNALRAQLAADVAAGTSLARVGAPGVSAPTANRYIISEGTYQNTLLIPAANGSVQFPQPVAGETIGQYAARVGLIDDDIYTIVVIGVSPTDFAYEYVTDEGQLVEEASLGRATFRYLQLRVKNGVQAATAAITGDTELTDIFQVFPDKTPFNGYTLSSTITFADLVENPDWSNGAIGVIRSRDDSDLRSSTTMQLVGDGTFGITARWLLDVWRKESQIGQSDLILEGSNFVREGYEPDAIRAGQYAVLGEFNGIQNPIIIVSGPDDGLSMELALVSEEGSSNTAWLYNNNTGSVEEGDSFSSSDVDEINSAIINFLQERYEGLVIQDGGTTVAEQSQLTGIRVID